MGKCMNKLRLIGFEKLVEKIETVCKLINMDAEDFCNKQIIKNIKLFNGDFRQDDKIMLLIFSYLVDKESNIKLIILKSGIVSKELLNASIVNNDYVYKLLLLKDEQYTEEENIEDIIKLSNALYNLTPITLGLKRAYTKGFYGIKITKDSLTDSTGKEYKVCNSYNVTLDITQGKVVMRDRVNDRLRWDLDISDTIKRIIDEFNEIYKHVSCGGAETWEQFIFWGGDVESELYNSWIEELENETE